MPRKVGRPPGVQTRQRRISKLMEGDLDIVSAAKTANITPADFAQWAADARNVEGFTAMCRLADMQAQLLISRYRLHAAAQLAALVTSDEPDSRMEKIRRACVELLKIDLKRVDTTAARPGKEQTRDADDRHQIDALLEAIYTSDEVDSDTAPAPAPGSGTKAGVAAAVASGAGLDADAEADRPVAAAASEDAGPVASVRDKSPWADPADDAGDFGA